jgi:hypothetical protein
MGILIGPTPWWQSLVVSTAPVGSTLPDGSRLICKAGGTAWIVAPANTQVSQTWNNTTNTLVGNKCCVCDWPTLCTRLISCGFNPGDWFVPSEAQLQNPGYVCRTQWDTFSAACYWASTEIVAGAACSVWFVNGLPNCAGCKSNSFCVRAFRCVTY